MANPKFKNVHLPPLHDEDEISSMTTLFEGGGDDIAQPTVIALSSTTSSMRGLKADIIEAWKRRKKKLKKESRYQHRLPHLPTRSWSRYTGCQTGPARYQYRCIPNRALSRIPVCFRCKDRSTLTRPVQEPVHRIPHRPVRSCSRFQRLETGTFAAYVL
jgi:hypothetical protein